MVKLLNAIIYIIGFFVVLGVIFYLLGYRIDADYWNSSQENCSNKIFACGYNVLHKGLTKANCEFNCVEFKKLIYKGSAPE